MELPEALCRQGVIILQNFPEPRCILYQNDIVAALSDLPAKQKLVVVYMLLKAVHPWYHHRNLAQLQRRQKALGIRLGKSHPEPILILPERLEHISMR